MEQTPILKARVNPFERGIELRKTLVKDDKVLCVDFEKTVQKQDLTKGHFKDEATGTYPYRAKINIKHINDEWRAKNSLPPLKMSDFSDKESLYRAIKEALDEEFDIPLWFLRKAGDDLENISVYDMAVTYQIKGCDYHDGNKSGGCVYCFVDNKSNSGEPEDGTYLSVKNIVDSFQSISKKIGTKVIRTSGGEPTLVLDHILSLYEEMERRGIDPILAQFDTNLSTGKLIEYFEEEGVYEKNILEKIAYYDPKVLVAFKGTSDESISQNVQAGCTVDDQTYSLTKLVKAGLDVYPYIYNPDPKTLESFINRLEGRFENMLPKIHIGQLKVYTPTRERVALIAQDMGRKPKDLLSLYGAEWNSNYEKSCEIMNSLCLQRLGVRYKEIERPFVKIKLKV